MQPFDFLMLMVEDRITQGLPLTLTCLLSVFIVPACLIHLLKHNNRQSKPGVTIPVTGTRQLEGYRSACHDFEQEVSAWEQAVRQKGGKL